MRLSLMHGVRIEKDTEEPRAQSKTAERRGLVHTSRAVSVLLQNSAEIRNRVHLQLLLHDRINTTSCITSVGVG